LSSPRRLPISSESRSRAARMVSRTLSKVRVVWSERTRLRLTTVCFARSSSRCRKSRIRAVAATMIAKHVASESRSTAPTEVLMCEMTCRPLKRNTTPQTPRSRMLCRRGVVFPVRE